MYLHFAFSSNQDYAVLRGDNIAAVAQCVRLFSLNHSTGKHEAVLLACLFDVMRRILSAIIITNLPTEVAAFLG